MHWKLYLHLAIERILVTEQIYFVFGVSWLSFLDVRIWGFSNLSRSFP